MVASSAQRTWDGASQVGNRLKITRELCAKRHKGKVGATGHIRYLCRRGCQVCSH